MKKANCLLAILLILAVMPSMAQSEAKTDSVKPSKAQSEQKIDYYIGGGGAGLSTAIYNANFYGEPELNGESTFGYSANINFGFDFDHHFGFKMEVGYAALGQKYSGTQYDTAATRTINNTFIMIPFLMKYRVGGEHVKFYVLAGPQIGILLSATQDYKRGGADVPTFESPGWGTIEPSQSDIKERTNTIQGFGRIDLGIEITPSEHFMIDIGVTGALGVTDNNQHDYRMLDVNKEYHISHNAYAGLNIGINYRW